MWLSPEDLDGVPQAELDRFSVGKEGPNEGMLFIRTQSADPDIIVRHATNPRIRKRVYLAEMGGLEENVDLLRDIIWKRDDNACLLGYSSHAAFRLERRVAKTVEWVDEFLSDVESNLLERGAAEMKLLMERKASYVQADPKRDEPYPDCMPPWDYPFYSHIVQEEMNIRHEQIAEYFPLRNTLMSMLNVFASCLQLQFIPLEPETLADSIWHNEVEAWSVWDLREKTRGEFVGYLYADVLQRPGKHKGSQNVNLQCGYLKKDGRRVYPATILMCNFSCVSAVGCPLLKHHQLVSLFHELGHGIHDLLSRTSYIKLHGHRAPPDFAEAPSIMLENWCWMEQELQQMSCHYSSLSPEHLAHWQKQNKTAEVPSTGIPDDLLSSLVQSRGVNRGLWFLRQLAISRFDLAIHNPPNRESLATLDLTKLWARIWEHLTLTSCPDMHDRGYQYGQFGHLLSGYDAGYYSYLWYEKDAPSTFTETTYPRCYACVCQTLAC
ncbi:hypothetical protein FJTKL_01450 [Diaporthe vaccinii]|uniref:Peptidase M3A/M3B catalytic domain-containing protein n=1 Tax=Diaporthe vaccinii TaxID=105482 RepID=A0ABR4E0D8_9PEZI